MNSFIKKTVGFVFVATAFIAQANASNGAYNYAVVEDASAAVFAALPASNWDAQIENVLEQLQGEITREQLQDAAYMTAVAKDLQNALDKYRKVASQTIKDKVFVGCMRMERSKPFTNDEKNQLPVLRDRQVPSFNSKAVSACSLEKGSWLRENGYR